MSKIVSKKIICPICGKGFDAEIIMSTNSFGSADLDTRPAPMARMTLKYQVHICPSCHYAYPELLLPNEIVTVEEVEKILESNEYIETLRCQVPNLPKKFILSGIINRKCGLYLKSFFMYLKASWAFDDNYLKQDAIETRIEASRIHKLIPNKTLDQEVIGIDVLRRANLFKEASNKIDEIIDKLVKDSLLFKIVNYELKLINNKDNKCYKVQSALNEYI